MSTLYFVYILQSDATGRLYIGQTHDLGKRIVEHNEGLSRSTKGYRPWTLLHFEAFETLQGARSLEQKLKRWKNPGKVLEWIERQKAGPFVEQRPDPRSG